MLTLNNITKVFNASEDSNDIKIALNNINLHIKDGDFVTVIGSNGSGKSTLFNIISGALSPEEGSITLDGIDVTKDKEFKRAKNLGIVLQDPLLGTAANMSILENLTIAKLKKKRKGFKWAFNKDLNSFFIDLVKPLNLDLENRLEQKIGLLSGGQRQAITLLMATLEAPKLLLLDEHTAALDPKTAKTVLELTNSIVKEKNLTTIMVTHNMKDALTYGNRLIMLKEGKILLDVQGKEKNDLSIEKLVHLFY